MAVSLTCPRCTRTVELLDTDEIRCPFCAKPCRRRRVPVIRVLLGSGEDAGEHQVFEILFGLAFLAIFAAFFVGIVLDAWPKWFPG